MTILVRSETILSRDACYIPVSCCFFIGDYIQYAKVHTDSFAHNKRMWKYCLNGRNNACYESDMLNKFCSMFPFQSMKTVRLRANLSRELLEDERWVLN